MDRQLVQNLVNNNFRQTLRNNTNIWDPSNKDKTCLWHCLAHELYKPPNQKSLESKVVELMCSFHKINRGNIKDKNNEGNKFVRNYIGFTGDLTEVCNELNITITVFDVEFEQRFIYDILDTFNPEKEKTNANGEIVKPHHINLL
jgi:hypothetical protein